MRVVGPSLALTIHSLLRHGMRSWTWTRGTCQVQDLVMGEGNTGHFQRMLPRDERSSHPAFQDPFVLPITAQIEIKDPDTSGSAAKVGTYPFIKVCVRRHWCNLFHAEPRRTTDFLGVCCFAFTTKDKFNVVTIRVCWPMHNCHSLADSFGIMLDG